MNADETWDVLVVGAGPAGALAARELAQLGDRVLLVDRKSFPRDKLCGACVNGRSLSVLRAAGLAGCVVALGAVPLRRFQLCCAGHAVTVDLSAGVAVSRKRFDAELVRAAVAAGATFLPGTTAKVGAATGRERRVRLRRQDQVADAAARVVLVADGLGHPSLAGHAEFRVQRARRTRIGCGTRLPEAPAGIEAGTIYMAVGRHGYVGLVRLEDGSLNVAAAMDPLRSGVGSLDPAPVHSANRAGIFAPSSPRTPLPPLCGERVRSAGPGGPRTVPALWHTAQSILAEAGMGFSADFAALRHQSWSGTPALTEHPANVFGRRVFLLGDAAGYVEPFTGEGIAWALESAVAIGPLAHEAAAAWRDALGAEWGHAHRRLIRHRQWLCSGLAWVLRRPGLVRSAMRLVSSVPSIADRLVGLLNDPATRALDGVTSRLRCGADLQPLMRGRELDPRVTPLGWTSE